MKGITFRPSACGGYIVSLVGELPRVMPVHEAELVRDLYREKQREMAAAGRIIAEEHEKVVADALDQALNQAQEMRVAITKRAAQG